jgi:DNA polymerase III epsilon subunit-like protein
MSAPEVSRTLFEGAILEQRRYWQVVRVDAEYAWVRDYPLVDGQTVINEPIRLLIKNNMIDPPTSKQYEKAGVTAVAFDVETGGADVEKNALLSIGAVEFDLGSGEIVDEFYALMKPHETLGVNPYSVKIHGLDSFALRDAPTEYVALGKFYKWALSRSGLEWWAHNASFDERFLDAALARHTTKVPPYRGQVRCSIKRAKDAGRESRLKLEEMAMDLCGVTRKGKTHDALEDSRMLARVVAAMESAWPRQQEAEL